MSSPSEQKPVQICLDDIREELNKIEDKSLSLKIIEALESGQNQLAQQVAIIAEMTARNESLLETNNKLFARVSAFTERDAPSSTTDYSDMNNQKFNDLLNRI